MINPELRWLLSIDVSEKSAKLMFRVTFEEVKVIEIYSNENLSLQMWGNIYVNI